MKEAVTKVIDTLTQEDFYGAFQKLFDGTTKVHCSWRRLLRRGLKFHVFSINKIRKKSGNLFNDPRIYIYIYIYIYSPQIRTPLTSFK